MRIKKIISAIVVLAFVIGVGMIWGQHEQKNTDQKVEEPVVPEVKKGANASALYYSYGNYKDMVEHSDVVVRGTVKEHYLHEKEISTYSVMDVQEYLKGENEKEIRILQMNDDDLLEENKEYVLFLVASALDDYTYGIAGGIEGIAVVSDNSDVEFLDEQIGRSYRELASSESLKDICEGGK